MLDTKVRSKACTWAYPRQPKNAQVMKSTTLTCNMVVLDNLYVDLVKNCIMVVRASFGAQKIS